MAAVENARSKKAFEKFRQGEVSGTQRSGVTCIFREALGLDVSETKVVVLKPLYYFKNSRRPQEHLYVDYICRCLPNCKLKQKFKYLLFNSF